MLAETRLDDDLLVTPEEMQAICGEHVQFPSLAWYRPMLDGYRADRSASMSDLHDLAPRSVDGDGVAFDVGRRLLSLHLNTPVPKLATYPIKLPDPADTIVFGVGARSGLWNVAVPGGASLHDAPLEQALRCLGDVADKIEPTTPITVPTPVVWRSLLSAAERIDRRIETRDVSENVTSLIRGLEFIAFADRNPALRICLTDMLCLGWTIGTTPERQQKLSRWLPLLGVDPSPTFNRRIASSVVNWIRANMPLSEDPWGPEPFCQRGMFEGVGRPGRRIKAFHVYVGDASSIWTNEEDGLGALEEMLWDDPMWMRRGVWTGDVVVGRFEPGRHDLLRSPTLRPTRFKRDGLCRVRLADGRTARVRMTGDTISDTSSTFSIEPIAVGDEHTLRTVSSFDYVMLTPRTDHPRQVVERRWLTNRNLRAKTWLTSNDQPDPIGRRAPAWVSVLAAGVSVGQSPAPAQRRSGHPGDDGR